MILFKFYVRSEIREGIIRCILATDMARHNEILTQFQEVTPTFDYSNEVHINLVSCIYALWWLCNRKCQSIFTKLNM